MLIQPPLCAPWCTQNTRAVTLQIQELGGVSHTLPSPNYLGFEAETSKTSLHERSGRAMGRDRSSEAELGGHAALPSGVAPLEAKAWDVSCTCPLWIP